MNQHDWQASGNRGQILVAWIPLDDGCLRSGDDDPAVCVSTHARVHVCVCVVGGGVLGTRSSSLAFIRDWGGEEEKGGLRAGGGQVSQLRAPLAKGSLTNF